MIHAIIFIIGVASGLCLALYIRHVNTKKNIFGELVINTSDPLKDVFSFEFTRHPDEMMDKKRVIFEVKPQ